MMIAYEELVCENLNDYLFVTPDATTYTSCKFVLLTIQKARTLFDQYL